MWLTRIGLCVDCGRNQTLGRHGECGVCGSRSILSRHRHVDVEAIRRQRFLMYEAAVMDYECPEDTRAMAAEAVRGGLL